jgi:hypothetical protein
MSSHHPRIRVYTKDGWPLIHEGLSLCFYMHRPHVELKQAVMQSLETFLRIVGPQALGLYTDEEGDWQDLDDAAWEHIRREMAERRGWVIALQDAGGREPRFAFDYYGKPLDEPSRGYKPEVASAVSFWLPTEYLEEHGPEHVRELSMEIAAPLPFTSGNVGLSFNNYPYHLGVQRALREHCFRYPGIDIYNLSTYAMQIGTRVRGPTWMTFLGPTVLREVGGVESLQARLHSPGTTVQTLGAGRAVITLGPQPEAGDTEQGNLLPAYRELARVLEPWLFHEKNRIDASFPAEDMLRWERRFLD